MRKVKPSLNSDQGPLASNRWSQDANSVLSESRVKNQCCTHCLPGAPVEWTAMYIGFCCYSSRLLLS